MTTNLRRSDYITVGQGAAGGQARLAVFKAGGRSITARQPAVASR